MRERYGSPNFDLAALSYTPHHATEIAEAVDRDDGGLVKWRREEGAGEMRTMMLDEVNLCPGGLNSLRSKFQPHLDDAGAVRGAGCDTGPAVWPQCNSQDLVRQMSLGITRDRNVVWLLPLKAGLRRKHRKTSPVLDTIEALLFECRD